MNIVLAALNTKYIHSNLAIRYLKAYVDNACGLELAEFTINQKSEDIAAEIFLMKPSLVGFSAYIWNIDQILDVCSILKLASPEIKILLGGPEVSYDPKEIIDRNSFVDMVIYGEGELTFKELITGVKVTEILGLAYRDGNRAVVNSSRPLIEDLSLLTFPYTDEDKLENKIVYYEASRGCPFNCAFCLSSTIRGVRFFPIERVKRDLDYLMISKAKQVKFVDRTFNANKEFSNAIMEHIVESDPDMTSFHLEITAHLIDEEQLNFFKKLKKDLFQFEIGVQSTNEPTIEAIGRKTDFSKLRKVSKLISSYGNIHQHLDLIAGLPFESYERFGESFDDLFEIQPEKIQLGFLKLLKGSSLREKSEKYGYKFQNKAPYEILSNKYISYFEIIKLKDIEKLVDIYYNEKLFEHSLNYFITSHYKGAFAFLESFSDYWRKEGLYKKAHSRDDYYSVMLAFYRSKDLMDYKFFKDLSRFDYVVNMKGGGVARCFGKQELLETYKIHSLLRNRKLIAACMPNEDQSTVKEILKKVRFEIFNWKMLEFLDEQQSLPLREEKTILMFYNHQDTKQRSKVFDITDYYMEE